MFFYSPKKNKLFFRNKFSSLKLPARAFKLFVRQTDADRLKFRRPTMFFYSPKKDKLFFRNKFSSLKLPGQSFPKTDRRRPIEISQTDYVFLLPQEKQTFFFEKFSSLKLPARAFKLFVRQTDADRLKFRRPTMFFYSPKKNKLFFPINFPLWSFRPELSSFSLDRPTQTDWNFADRLCLFTPPKKKTFFFQ